MTPRDTGPIGWRRAEWLTVSEAGRCLGLAKSRTYELVAEGVLPTFSDRLGRRRVRPAEVERLLRKGWRS